MEAPTRVGHHGDSPRWRTATQVGDRRDSGCLARQSKALHRNESDGPTGAPDRRPPLDTSAQLDKPGPEEARRKLQKRARAKYLTTPIVRALLEVGGPLHKSYRRSLDCYALLEQRDGQLIGKRCKARWCLACNRIRTGITWERYQHLLATDGNPESRDFMVTLTVPNVQSLDLRCTVQQMHRTFARIARRMKGAKSRPSIDALRKTEVTYNEQRDDFHPHLHVIARGESAAAMLLELWLGEWPSAKRSAQDIRPLSPGGAAEVFKYFTKLIAKNSAGDPRAIAPQALDCIFRALRNLRTLEPYGLFRSQRQHPHRTDEELMDEGYTSAPSARTHPVVWRWEQDTADWMDARSGELLSGYEPSPHLQRLAQSLSTSRPSTPTKQPHNHPRPPHSSAFPGPPGRSLRPPVQERASLHFCEGSCPVRSR